MHAIFDPTQPDQASGVAPYHKGTKAVYNFTDKKQIEDYKNMEGIPIDDFAHVVHEMQHQYDYDINNMQDNTHTPSANNPAEQRGVKLENEARKQKGLPLRTTYGGEKVNPNPPNFESKNKKDNKIGNEK